MPPTPATQRLWSECPPLLPGHKLSDTGNGSAGYKLLALEATGAALNVYRGYDLAARRRCPTCGNHQPPATTRCRFCEADLREVNAGLAAVIVYESCDPGRLAGFRHMAQSQVRHPHLLLPSGELQAATSAGDLRHYLMLPENPAPALTNLPRPQSLLTVLRWGVQLAQALAALHGAGLVHGQIGEQTILIREDWTWLVGAPSLQPPAAGADAASDVRDLARLLLVLLSKESKPAGLMALHTPVRDALVPALSGALASENAASTMAGALADATTALQAAGDSRAATGWASHPGRRRTGNEDSLAVLAMDVSCAGVRTPLGLYLLADGAGGHAAGEIASQLAVQSIMSSLTANLTPLVASGRIPDFDRLREIAAQVVTTANTDLRELRAGRDSDMLTTVVLAVQVERRLLVASVGDSRAYLLRNGQLQQITTDHTLVARLIGLGQLMPEDARTHPRRHQLYRCLGQDDAVEADTFDIVVQPGDVLLLCSDGLYDEIEEGVICAILSHTEDLNTAGRLLVAAANDAGGRDNVSVVLTRPVPAA